jgi:hypothetical protein
MARKTIAETLENYRVLIFNSRKPEITPLIETLGVDSAYLDSGEILYNEVLRLSEKQKKEQQEESLAYDKFYELKGVCAATNKRNRKLIKMASRSDKDLQNRIKINVPTERRIEEWIQQTLQFNNLILNESDFLNSISKFGITSEKLTKEKADLESLKSLRNEAMSEKGQAQEATRLRNTKMEALEDYCYELKTIATIALEEQSQLLEELGIIVRN